MADKIKKRQAIPIYCPECNKTGGRPHILCIVDEDGDIIIRCKGCKTDINISQLMRK